MQTLKLKPVLQLATLNNNIFRTAAIEASVINGTEHQNLKSWKDIPGPSRLPIIGQAHHFMPRGEFYAVTSLELGLKLYKKYGPIVRLDGFLGRLPFLLLFQPESCAYVLRSENRLPIRTGFESLDYYRKKYRRGVNSDTTGLLTDHGEPWKQFRSTVNPVLLQPKTIKLYSEKIDEVAQDMVVRMKSLRGQDNTIQGDFELLMNLWSLESIALVALGRRLNCFRDNLPPDSPEKKLIKSVHEVFKVADELDFKPSIWRYYPTKAFKSAMALYREQEEVAKHFIDKTIEEIDKKATNKSEDEKSVLEKLLEINKDVALIMASDILFAGVDTTSNTMTGTLYLLAKNQDKQDKLREEIFARTDPSEKVPYLRACIKESMRMMPITAGNVRKTTKEYNLLGYRIPEGMQVTFLHHTMSMMEEHYPRPNEFLPERWIVKKDDDLYHGNTHPFVTQPFGFGVRSCIGRRIAELELETFLTRLIQNFKIEWFGPPMPVKSMSLNYTVGPYNFIFKDV